MNELKLKEMFLILEQFAEKLIKMKKIFQKKRDELETKGYQIEYIVINNISVPVFKKDGRIYSQEERLLLIQEIKSL